MERQSHYANSSALGNSGARPSSPARGIESNGIGNAGGTGRRLRALAACQVCRARKVKCSNEKPSCAGCARLGCECVYPEPVRYGMQRTVAPPPPSSSQSNSEVVGILQAILNRLPPASEPRHEGQTDYAAAAAPISLGFTALEQILEWPILGGDQLGQSSAAFNVLGNTRIQNPHQDESSAIAIPRLDLDEITALLTKFLRMVHIMNPILDCTTLMTSGRIVAELGPQWDSRTCLVLLAAALGSIAMPFNSMPESSETLSRSSPSPAESQHRQTGEQYYQYARRRFGLLGMSLTACHCHFLSGIYLLYNLRPTEAWQSFFQASSMYTVYLKSGTAAREANGIELLNHPMVPGAHCCDDETRQGLEQRLYWSCLKSESELCAEVELPRSALLTIDYPYQFPSPPTPKSVDGLDSGHYPDTFASSTETAASSTTGNTSDVQDFKELHEYSWFNYLSEISLSRLSSRVNQVFYSAPPSSWAGMNVLDMIGRACDFEKQMDQWQETLPSAISCFNTPMNLSTVTELQLSPWLRSANIKLRIYRPFLYRLAHEQEQDWPVKDALRQLAERAVRLCLDPLFNIGLRHRHAGAWLRCRETSCRALTITVARRIGLVQSMGLEQHAQETLRVCIGHLRYWEAEANDVKSAREVLEMLC